MNGLSTTDMWTYGDFEPGNVFGEMSLHMDAERISRWNFVYRDNSEIDPQQPVPRGLLVAGMMEAYLGLVAPRPPGNIHASQKLLLSPAQARMGDTLLATVSCLSKQRRKERGWVTFEVRLSKDGHQLLSGEIQTIWAR